jgi:hypothetical protein
MAYMMVDGHTAVTVDPSTLLIPEGTRTGELVRLSSKGGSGPSMVTDSWAVVERTSRLQRNEIPSRERTIRTFIDPWLLSTALILRQNNDMIGGRFGRLEGESLVVVVDPWTRRDPTWLILAEVREMCKSGPLSPAGERYFGGVTIGCCLRAIWLRSR